MHKNKKIKKDHFDILNSFLITLLISFFLIFFLASSALAFVECRCYSYGEFYFPADCDEVCPEQCRELSRFFSESTGGDIIFTPECRPFDDQRQCNCYIPWRGTGGGITNDLECSNQCSALTTPPMLEGEFKDFSVPEEPTPSKEIFPTYKVKTPIGEVTGPQLIGRIIKTVLTLVGAFALAMFVYGGFTWLTSGGSPDKIKKGKDILIWATIGLAVIFASYTLVDFVIRTISGT